MGIRTGHNRIFYLLLTLLLAAFLGRAGYQNATATPAGVAASFIREYALPESYGSPHSITVEAPGQIWFTLPAGNAIGSLTVTSPTDYEFNRHIVPTGNSEPFEIVYHDGAVWFTERSGNKIGRLDTTTLTWTEYPVPTSSSAPSGIDVGPDGNIWIVETNANKVARLNTESGDIDEYAYEAAPTSRPEHISVGSDNVWFTVPNLNRVVRYRISTGEFVPVPVADFGVDPFPPAGIVLDSSNLPWITAPTKDLIGRYAPGTLAYWRWQSLNEGGYPTALTQTRQGTTTTVWFVATEGGRVGHLAATDQQGFNFIREHPLPSANSQPRDIAVDDNGHAWISESGTNKIAEWYPPYFHYNHLPVIFRQ